MKQVACCVTTCWQLCETQDKRSLNRYCRHGALAFVARRRLARISDGNVSDC